VAVQHPEALSSPRRSQVERRSEAETALLDAAMRLFARQGVEATSLAAIGDEAGYSRGLANHHFGSRAALVEQLARRGQRRFARGVEHIEGSAIDTVVAVADTYLSLFDDPTADVRAFFVMRGGAIPLDAPLRATYAADDRRFRGGIERVIRAGQAKGTVNADVDPAAFAAMVVGMLRGVASQCLMDADAVDLDTVRATTRALITATLTPAPTC
jgi:AcrR family transcriptional regulator